MDKRVFVTLVVALMVVVAGSVAPGQEAVDGDFEAIIPGGEPGDSNDPL